MRIRIRLFASLAQAAGFRERELEVPDGAVASDVAARILGPIGAGSTPILCAVNREHCTPSRALADGDELALFPPVSGGSGDEPALLVVTAEALEPARIADLVRHPSCGAVVTFEGVVRDHGPSGTVVAIAYEAYPEMALEVLRRIRGEVAAAHPGARLAMFHRTGRLLVGEPSVVVACAAPHRIEAFAACQLAMDRIKEILPVWKAEEDAAGSRQWR